jgi:hypothetical protein
MLATIRAANATKENVEFQKVLATATIKSAEAAEAALQANRPFLLVTKLRSEKSSVGYKRTIYVCMRNFGISPADIRDYHIDTQFLDVPRPPRTWEPIRPWYGPDQGFVLHEPLVVSGEEIERIRIRVEISPYQYAELCDRKVMLIVHGRVRYRGAPKQGYCTRFFWLYVPDGTDGQFVRPFPDPFNEYT